MLFNSFEFWVFFVVVIIVYFISTYIVKKNLLTQTILLIASLFFYGCWNPVYLFLILVSICITWFSGLFMEKIDLVGKNCKKRKQYVLALSLVSNLLILFFFKYYDFFARSVVSLSDFFKFSVFVPHFDILLPVGISFYTFQALGYSIDIYREKVKAEHNFITYALFVTFFPQLVAGPIERTASLLPQFKVDYRFDYIRVTDGLKLALWGMFKKVVIADRLAIYVNAIYNNVYNVTGCALVLATFFFAFQILCDFSGYSDIALGVAKVLGFNLMQNFKRPYFSKSIAEFWRRWHISLSGWFKDYVYFPLGGSRVSVPRHYLNLIITFTISGLWHGASWHFVVWGLLHSVYQIVEHIAKHIWEKLHFNMKINDAKKPENNTKYWKKGIQILWTFCLVCIGWVFFRVNSISEIPYIFKKIIYIPSEIVHAFTIQENTGIIEVIRSIFLTPGTGIGFSRQFINMGLILVLVLVSLCTRSKSGVTIVNKLPFGIRWTGYIVVFWVILMVMVYQSASIIPTSQFVYFQF